MSFCGRCGTPMGEEKFCPNCGAVNESYNVADNVVAKSPTASGGKKKIITGSILLVAVIVIVWRLFLLLSMSAEPCDWCGDSPSVAYKTSDGSKAYVCRKCSKECAWCDNRATNHYENLLGMIVFVCDDCYEDAVDD